MQIAELKDHVASVLEKLAALDHQIGELSASSVAMRQALGEVSPDRFEPAYQRHDEASLPRQIRKLHETGQQELLAIAKILRESP